MGFTYKLREGLKEPKDSCELVQKLVAVRGGGTEGQWVQLRRQNFAVPLHCLGRSFSGSITSVGWEFARAAQMPGVRAGETSVGGRGETIRAASGPH